MPAPLVLAQDISKSYGGVSALRGAQFELRAAEVHALLGENGAGKSTLARILAGVVRPDGGEIWWEGRKVALRRPLDAQRLGIGIIHQELDLFPDLSVGENIVIGNLRFSDARFVRRRAIETFCRPYLEQVDLSLSSGALVCSLSLAQQQLLAVARSLSMHCRILIMDEPTSALPEGAAERLFAVVDALKDGGVSIVYVSHKMDEIFRLCNRATVLRDGETIGTREVIATDRVELIRMMVGRDIDLSRRPIRGRPGSVRLSVAHLTTKKLRQVSFEVRSGEVLGIAGLVGAGRSELGAALFGLDRVHSGSMHVDAAPFAPRTPAEAQRRGLGLVPEDRKREGLMLQMSVRENATLCILPRLSRGGFLRTSEEMQPLAPVMRRLRLKCLSAEVLVGRLSGGNQQKTLLARALLADTGILFLDDPARGVDVAAKEDIYRLIDEIAESGRGVVMASSELPELLRCCDRILVLNEGRVTGHFLASEATQEKIMQAATQSSPLVAASA